MKLRLTILLVALCLSNAQGQDFRGNTYLGKSKTELVRFCSVEFSDYKIEMSNLNDSISILGIILSNTDYDLIYFYIHDIEQKCTGYTRVGSINDFSDELSKIKSEGYIQSPPPLDGLFSYLINGKLLYMIEMIYDKNEFRSFYMTEEMYVPRLFGEK